MSKEGVQVTTEGAIEQYGDMVYRIALAQVRNPVDADDVFQEVFIRLVSNIHKLKTWEHAKAWLIRVTINCSIKHFSHSWNRNVFLTGEQDIFHVQENEYSIQEGNPVEEAVGLLPLKYRAVVHLFYYEELSIKEIADITKQKESTVKSQMSRAREMLRKILGGDRDI